MTPDERSAIESLAISLDREAEVPLGVQLAWAIRARVRDGRLPRGQRLPGLRELADAVGVNFNTVRAVYQRLENDGLVTTQQGSGTYIAASADRAFAIGDIASQAARDAVQTGVDPRDVAAALYMASRPESGPAGDEAARRRQLRTQIAALEQALGELQAQHPQLVSEIEPVAVTGQPRLLGAEELERQRSALIRALAGAQRALEKARRPGAPRKPPAAPSADKPAPATPRRSARVKPSGKIAPAGT